LNIEKVIQEDRQAKLTVEYSTEEFQTYKIRAAKKIAKNVKIPGFRPGKAPYSVIVNHYGEGAVVQEAFDMLIDEDYPKFLDETEIEPSGPGNLETIESLDPPKFVLFVPLTPEVDLGDYREIRKAFEMEEFDATAVEDYITQLRRNSATIVPADRSAEVNDLVYFNLSGEFLNPAEDEDATITDKTPQQAIIPAADAEVDEDEWPYPGFSQALVGVQPGDVKELQFTYPEDYDDEDFRGKTAIFTVEVQSVKALELPEFDETFVQSLGDFESPEDFRETVEENLRAEHEDDYEQAYFNDLLTEIIENATINYPPQMLEHEAQHVLEDLEARLENQNMEFETFLRLRNTDEETFMAEEIRPIAKQNLERSLVVDALIEAEELKLDNSLFEEHINDVMRDIFRSGRAEELQKQMDNDEFSRLVSMEGYSRTMNVQLMNRLKLIGTGQPIPEPEELEEVEEIDQEQTSADQEPAATPENTETISDDSQHTEQVDGSDRMEAEEDQPESTSKQEVNLEEDLPVPAEEEQEETTTSETVETSDAQAQTELIENTEQ